MRSRSVPFCLLSCLIAGPVWAGVVVQMTKTDLASGKEVPADRFYVQGSMLKVEPAAIDEDYGVIFRDDSLYVIDHEQKTYQHLSGEKIRSTAAQVGPMLEQMRQQMQNLPPGQRAAVEKMMREQMGLDSLDPPQIEVRPTERSDEVSGIDCRVWDMLVNGERTHEVCIAAVDSVDGGAEVSQALRAMAQFQQGILESLGLGAAAANPFMNLTELEGVPVQAVTYERERAVEQIRLNGTERKQFDDADFLPPTDYRVEKSPL